MVEGVGIPRPIDHLVGLIGNAAWSVALQPAMLGRNGLQVDLGPPRCAIIAGRSRRRMRIARSEAVEVPAWARQGRFDFVQARLDIPLSTPSRKLP